MACTENVVKNIARDVTRNCQAKNVLVDTEFVIYLINLLLLNPKHGKLFWKAMDRDNLQHFVDECVGILVGDDTSLSTLKMQFIIQNNYDKIQNLIDRHMDSIASCLQPLVNEILEEDPENTDVIGFKKLFRKISIYIILASGLGNPGIILTLKEGMAALESVFSLEELKIFVAQPRTEKLAQLNDLVEVVSGVRLFNRDCKKGGEGIPDLPFNLVDAGKACLTSLSNSLVSVMQRVNMLTTAIDDAVLVQDETGNVEVTPSSPQLTLDHYKQVFALLALNRQYEIFIRKLLSDVERTVQNGALAVQRCRLALEEIHQAVKYKAAVPVVTVFPLFAKLWRVWRSMQHVMYVVSRVSRLMSALAAAHERASVPRHVIDAMLRGRRVCSDQERMNSKVSMEDRLVLGSIKNYEPCSDNFYLGSKDRSLAFLGFCAMCLAVGALVPSNMRLGCIKLNSHRYGFCNVKMAVKFGRKPKRYINEVLDYARNNLHLIHLLNIAEDVFQVRDVDSLVTKYSAKIKVSDKESQTDTHLVSERIDTNYSWDLWEWKRRACQWASVDYIAPDRKILRSFGHLPAPSSDRADLMMDTHLVSERIDTNYSWDLWEWKRRACQWASIVKCRTHSTQTEHSHHRSDFPSQTYETRDRGQQTGREAAVNTLSTMMFLWGLRQPERKQRVVDLDANDVKGHVISVCSWPCIDSKEFVTPQDSAPSVE